MRTAELDNADAFINTSWTTLDIFISTYCVDKMHQFWWMRLKEPVIGASMHEISRGANKASIGKIQAPDDDAYESPCRGYAVPV